MVLLLIGLHPNIYTLLLAFYHYLTIVLEYFLLIERRQRHMIIFHRILQIAIFKLELGDLRHATLRRAAI